MSSNNHHWSSNRDAAVVPWISLRTNNTTPPSRSSSSSSSSATTTTNNNPSSSSSSSSNCKILSLLSARERIGTKEGNGYGQCGGWSSEGVAVTHAGLSGAGAWNPRRLQNMTLSIGPGTPASCVLPANVAESNSEDDGEEDESQSQSRSQSQPSSSSSAEEDGAGSNNEDDNWHVGDGTADDDEEKEEGESSSSSSSSSSEEEEGDAMELINDPEEEGREYHFDASGKLVKTTAEEEDDDDDDTEDDGLDAAREEAESEIVKQPSARITQSPGENQDDEEEDDEEKEVGDEDDDRPRRGTGNRRSRWEKKQKSILDALNGNDEDDDDEEEEEDMDESIGNRSHHANIDNEAADANQSDHNSNDDDDDDDNQSGNDDDSSSHRSGETQDSAGLTDRDRRNIRQVEQYIDHLETLHRRRNRNNNEGGGGGGGGGNSGQQPARGPPGATHDEDGKNRMYEREAARSMKHGGCINTVSWLDCGWRISTVSHEDAAAGPYDYYRRHCNEGSGSDGGGFVSSSASYSSNNYSPHVTPTQQRRRTARDGKRGSVVAPLSPNECPTQLLTSGDDHLVKFWDVSRSMGGASPLPGGSATGTPFSSERMPMRASAELVDAWRNHGGGGGYHVSSSTIRGSSSSSSSHHRGRYLPGVVHPLVTLNSGHRGNVFHASPIPHSTGKVATCAADGYLRLLDVEVHSASASTPSNNGRNRSNSAASSSSNVGEMSQVVISPEFQSENGEREPPSFRFRNSLMCFSHHFLSANVGLVCSERGLLHFDIRLPPRSQRRGSLVPELSGTCKSCFPWRLGGAEGDESEMESAYVFAGGSGVDVGLYDLRMTGSSSGNDASEGGSSQVVQKYRPRDLYKSSSVAVSGIDLSKDKRELLVSYESDHVYTFPIFPEAASAAGPTLEDIDRASGSKGDRPVPELAAYGGHLNRRTFLKMAKYAGPNDEYICTGSDSGHAWIYEKSTGTVVSFIKADSSTCNGIQSHPTLPFFITYGIDSTAKLWRATTPVDMDVDDSDLGRFEYAKRKVGYEKSVVVDQWKKARKGKEIDLDDENQSFFPDEISEDDNDDQDHFLGVFIRSRMYQDTPSIGNDLINLSDALAKNYFTCARSVGMGDDEPVKSGTAAMKRRVSLIKMRHQADRLGLDFDSRTPWILKPKEHLVRKSLSSVRGTANGNMVSYGNLADLIPDNPSDWIPFDKLLANPPRHGGMEFNSKYEHYHLESSVDHCVTPVMRACPNTKPIVNGKEGDSIIDQLDNEASKRPHTMQANEALSNSHGYDSAQAWDVLFKTVSLLKEAGNEALKASLPFVAARRYDKAINYCSVAYLEFPVGTVDFVLDHQYVLTQNSGYECRWNELLKTLIMIRLNLAMCFLKEEISDAKGAAAQASLSLKELKPFTAEKGVVLTGKKLAKKRMDEPHSTYIEAKTLQAKSFFRLGSSQLAMNEYDDAVKTLGQCVESTKEAGMTVDAGVLRKINEAKRCRKQKKERQRKKFKFMFSSAEKNEHGSNGDEGE